MEGRQAVLAVHGHPDDEAIFMGGTLARYAATGARVVCVTATRGELGEIVDPALSTSANRARLGELRMEEMRRAVQRLGGVEARWLGFRDSGMPGDAHNQDPEAFCRVTAQEAAGSIAQVIREVRPQVVITLDELRGDDHPDHVHAALAARLAFERAGNPTCWPEQLEGPGAVEPWSPMKLYATNGHSRAALSTAAKLRHMIREQGPVTAGQLLAKAVWRRRPGGMTVVDPETDAPDTRRATTTRIDVARWVNARQAAIRTYRTQIAPDDPILRLSARELARLSPTEDYRLIAGPTSGVPEADLFAGIE